MSADLFAWGIPLALLAYGLLGGVAMRFLWPPAQRPARNAGVAIWYAYWLPVLITTEIYILVGVTAFVICLLFLFPGTHDTYTLIGFGLGLGCAALGFTGLDVWMYLRVRSARRFETRDPTPPTL
jgi:hypothetical protein